MKSIKAIGLMCAAAALMALCACSGTPFSAVTQRENPASTDYLVEISPNEATEAYDTVNATLYFRLNSEALLAPTMTQVDLAVDQTREEAVINALLSGPLGNHELAAVIPEGTKLISVKSQHGYLEITLSNDFFNVSDEAPRDWTKYDSWRTEINEARLLATYSIVNTITEMGKYSRVLILIDVNGDGNGQRANRALFGIDVDGADEPIEPLGRDTSVILSPINAAQIVLDAQKAQNMDVIARFLYFDGADAPSTQTISETLFGDTTISSYDLLGGGGAIVSLDGARAVISVDYETIVSGVQRQSVTDIPLLLVLENNIWKVDYDSLCALIQQ